MSKKIFLLATGQSINDITEEQWEHIKSHDSIGISHFYNKGFETTYYYTHEYTKQPIIVAEKMLNLKTKVFFGTREFSGLYENKISSSNYAFNNYKDKLNCEEVKFSHWLNAWDGKSWLVNQEKPPLEFNKIWAKSKNDVLFGFRGTMMCALNLCSVLGYDEIILCGVDLKNGLHFYDEVKSVYSKQFGTDSIKDKHSTCVEYNGVRPVIDALCWLKDNLNIKVSSKNSLLYERGFDLYKF